MTLQVKWKMHITLQPRNSPPRPEPEVSHMETKEMSKTVHHSIACNGTKIQCGIVTQWDINVN